MGTPRTHISYNQIVERSIKEVRKNASLTFKEVLLYQCPDRKWNFEVECKEEEKVQSKLSYVCENVQGGVLHQVCEREQLIQICFYTFFYWVWK